MAVLKVLTHNINTGQGPKGNFRSYPTKSGLTDNLNALAKVYQESKADVLCLQEVDIYWHRTHRINQAEFIGREAGFPFLYAHPHHRSLLPMFLRQRLPYPDNVVINRDMGTAILSRFPLRNKRHYTFGQSLTSYPFVNYFARLLNESKGYKFAEVEVEGKKVGIMSVHLLNDVVYEILNYLGRTVRGETFARAWQMEKVLEHIKEYRHVGCPDRASCACKSRECDKSTSSLILAGDLNSVPWELDKLHFQGSKNGDPDDYTRDLTMHLIRRSKLLTTIPELFGTGNQSSITPFFTYPAIEPDRPLDYIFTTPGLRIIDYSVLDVCVSDHKPVLATIEV